MKTVTLSDFQAELIRKTLEQKIEECDRSLSNLEIGAERGMLEGPKAELHIMVETLRNVVAETLKEFN